VIKSLAASVVALVIAALPASAQGSRPLLTDADLLKEVGGVQLLHVVKGAMVTTSAAISGGFQATIEGWIPENALKDDKRDGFDVAVSLASGTTLRDKPGGSALASARLGALFDRIETKSNWVHVKRTGWISAAAFAAAPAASAAPPAAAPAPTAGIAAAATTIAAGTSLSALAGGAPVATLEAPLHADVVEHRAGWARVRIDAWVRDGAVGNAPEPGGITAAAIRAAPEKYVGQTVEWTIQLIGIQKADDLRPELPAGQPFLLARGPVPESGFLYIAVTPAEAEQFQKLEPLTKLKIRATIRAGKSRFLPTPVLNFVRRLD